MKQASHGLRRATPVTGLLRIALSIVGLTAAASATAESLLAIGPQGVQSLVAGQLFDRTGRWYLIDDGACRTFLDSPRTQLSSDRLVLHAHLTSRLGQSLGGTCAGADFASNVTLSGRLRGSGHVLVLEDIRIDRVDEESTRNALNLALQLDPAALPRSANIDVSQYVKRDLIPAGGAPTRLDEFHIVNITTRADAVVIHFDLRLSAP